MLTEGNQINRIRRMIGIGVSWIVLHTAIASAKAPQIRETVVCNIALIDEFHLITPQTLGRIIHGKP